MKETYSLGSRPTLEPHLKVNQPDYEKKALKECNVYRNQLIRMYQAANNRLLPADCHVQVKVKRYSGKTYYKVIVTWDFDPGSAADHAALWLDANTPQYWDELAKQELGT